MVVRPVACGVHTRALHVKHIGVYLSQLSHHVQYGARIEKRYEEIVFPVLAVDWTGKHLLEMPFYASHVSPRSQRYVFHLARAPVIHVDDEHALVMIHLGKRILQERSCVSNVRSARGLRPVQVPERGVVESGKERRVNLIRSTQGKRPLGFGLDSALDKRV